MTIYINGNIVTLSDKKRAEGFYVKDHIFAAVGSNDEIKRYITKDEEVIDLKGKTVIPGFNDCHMHFLNYAVTKDMVNITNIESIESMIIATKKYIDENNIDEGKWILSRGWNDDLFKEKRLPTRYDLDLISTKHPIFFSRRCGHIGVANSAALKLLNINSKTPNPEGGVIDMYEGEPTGILRENAQNQLFAALPPMEKEDIKRLFKNAFYDLLSVGLTSIQTEDIWQAGSLINPIKAYEELANNNELPVRVVFQAYLSDKESLEKAVSQNIKTGVGNNKFKIGPLKIFQDGSLGARTAAMKEPYSDTDTKGVPIRTQEELNNFTLMAHNLGFQLTIHAIGDAAVEQVLNSYENIYKENSTKDLRNSIIHCQFTNDLLLERFKSMNIVANVQPSFVMTDYPIVEKAVGKHRADKSYVWKDMINKGIHTAFSSDAPIESFNPIEGVYAAVTRKDLKGNPSEGWHKDQCLSVEDALKAYTIEPAYANFEENIKGTISEGKLADFVVLSEDITSIDKDKIKDIKVLETYVGGKRMY